jgi:hypothetical protein
MPFAAEKATIERGVFSRFVEFLEESEMWGAIESRDPPEPDLLCTHAERGRVAFELVAITDPLIAEVNAGYGRSPTGSYSTSDPTERIIRKKLGRRYVSDDPMELLIYNDLLVITPEDIIVEVTVNWLGSKSHQFTRAWFMGEHHAKLIWSANGEALDLPTDRSEI